MWNRSKAKFEFKYRELDLGETIRGVIPGQKVPVYCENHCYMNTAIQALASHNGFREVMCQQTNIAQFKVLGKYDLQQKRFF